MGGGLYIQNKWIRISDIELILCSAIPGYILVCKFSQWLYYGDSCPCLNILIKLSINNPSHKSVIMSFSAKPNTVKVNMDKCTCRLVEHSIYQDKSLIRVSFQKKALYFAYDQHILTQLCQPNMLEQLMGT